MPLGQKIIINHSEYETRVAILEKGNLTELFVERANDKSIVGNIYIGKVVRVLPGIQAAFVDIGLDRAAFLYVGDIHEPYRDDHLDVDKNGQDDKHGSKPVIQYLLKEGQEILVQVSKEPIGSKGAKVTSQITIPGRFLVFMPEYRHIGISRKIGTENERKRLRSILNKLRDEEGGYIIRTVSEGADESALKMDMDYLRRQWEIIQKNRSANSTPSLLHEELNVTLKTLRDTLTDETEQIVIDDEGEYERLKSFFQSFMPSRIEDLMLYREPEPIFAHYGIEMEIDEALNRRVWLKSGGYIIIEQTEALVAVDVNTGKFIGKKSSEDTILKTNLEALKEIAYQLRLRNIGGLIVIDFIDMEQLPNRKKVVDALRAELSRDRARATVLPMSEFGLVEVTRKRIKESLYRTLKEPCAYCEGRGYIKSRETVAYHILRDLEQRLTGIEGKAVMITANPEVADFLCDVTQEGLDRLETEHDKRIIVKADRALHHEEYEIADAQRKIN